jgi:hypothetical protein
VLTEEPQEFELSDGPSRLAFAGWLLGSVSSREHGKPDDWHTDLDVYRTVEGRFVCHRKAVRDGRTTARWRVFSTRREAQAWLGFGSLSLRLFALLRWPI